MKFEDVKPEVYGIIFGIFSLVVGYFLLELAIAVFHSGAVQAYIQKLASGEADLLPIPVFMALVVWSREVVVWGIMKTFRFNCPSVEYKADRRPALQ